MRRVEKKKKRKKKIDGHRVSSATTGYTGYTNDKDESNFTITQRYPTPRCKSTPGFLIIDKNVRTHVPIGRGEGGRKREGGREGKGKRERERERVGRKPDDVVNPSASAHSLPSVPPIPSVRVASLSSFVFPLPSRFSLFTFCAPNLSCFVDKGTRNDLFALCTAASRGFFFVLSQFWYYQNLWSPLREPLDHTCSLSPR